MVRTDHITIDPAYQETLRAHGLDRVESILALTRGKIVTWSRTTDSIYIPPVNGGVGFYVKRYTYPTWRSRIRGMFRGTFVGSHRGKCESRALTQMRHLGVPGVRPVAFGCRRMFRFLTACFLVTEETPGAPNLTTFAQDVQDGRRTLSFQQRVRMINGLAGQVARMHAAGFAHGRLFWRNVLVRFGPFDEPDFFLLDAEPPRRLESLGRGRQWWVWELANLAASAQPFTTRADRVRFARSYFSQKKLDNGAKQQIREIGALCEQWTKHERQRIRMNARFERWMRTLEAETKAGESA